MEKPNKVERVDTQNSETRINSTQSRKNQVRQQSGATESLLAGQDAAREKIAASIQRSLPNGYKVEQMYGLIVIQDKNTKTLATFEATFGQKGSTKGVVMKYNGQEVEFATDWNKAEQFLTTSTKELMADGIDPADEQDANREEALGLMRRILGRSFTVSRDGDRHIVFNKEGEIMAVFELSYGVSNDGTKKGYSLKQDGGPQNFNTAGWSLALQDLGRKVTRLQNTQTPEKSQELSAREYAAFKLTQLLKPNGLTVDNFAGSLLVRRGTKVEGKYEMKNIGTADKKNIVVSYDGKEIGKALSWRDAVTVMLKDADS